MFRKCKGALVKSFVGAIALGWIFAQGILHFAYIFSSPVGAWVSRRQFHGTLDHATITTGFSFQDALPEVAKSFALLIVGYLLLRWLYFKPLEESSQETGAD
jgi:hypothetical protein